MRNVPIKTQIKFLKYFWVSLFITIAANILYWNIIPYYNLSGILVYLIDINASSIGLYYMIRVLLGHKRRCETYIRLYNLYTEKTAKNERLKTYELYVIKQTLCGSTVVNQICKDFNIKL